MSKRNLIISCAVAALFAVYALGTATIVKEGEEAKLTGEVAFDPNTVVNDFWQKNAEKYFNENAVELTKLLEESGGDLKSVASKYGHYSMGDHGELSFVVKGKGVVKEVKDKLRSGYLLLGLDGYTGDKTFRLQIGPVFKGTAVRDSISLISYKDYKNQIEWAQVSVALYGLVQRDIVDKINVSELKDKNVEFIGCFTDDGNTLRITPVELKVSE